MDPTNAGVLLVHLQGGRGGAPDAGFTRDLAKQSTGDEESVSVAESKGGRGDADCLATTQCTIM